MSNKIGTLQVYPEEQNPAKKVSYNLREGEYVIGTHSNCDIILSFPNLAARHCKLILSKEGPHKIEDLGGQYGVYRVTPTIPRQKLRANTKYDLVPNSTFYLANKYKCIFETEEGKSYKSRNNKS